MSLLSELSAIAKKLKIPAQTSVYSGNAPDEYLVFTPLYDSFELHADNAPTADVQEVRDAAVAEHGGGIGLALGNQTDRLRRLHLNQAQLDVREHTELDHGTGRDSRAD